MADELTLLASKSDFDNLIQQIDGKMQTLQGIADQYEALRDNVSSFMEEEDDNLEKMKANVQENVKRVYEAIGAANTTKANLQSTVDEMEAFSSNVGTTLEEGVQTAQAVGKTIFSAHELGLI